MEGFFTFVSFTFWLICPVKHDGLARRGEGRDDDDRDRLTETLRDTDF